MSKDEQEFDVPQPAANEDNSSASDPLYQSHMPQGFGMPPENAVQDTYMTYPAATTMMQSFPVQFQFPQQQYYQANPINYNMYEYPNPPYTQSAQVCGAYTPMVSNDYFMIFVNCHQLVYIS